MKIATFNIDWLQKNKLKIENIFEINSFDILILTECVDNFRPIQYKWVYATKNIPLNTEYESQLYSKFVKKGNPIRVAIYSKYKSFKKYKVTDEYTSVCHEFDTEIGTITIYASIIGTLYKRLPYYKIELQNCITDCRKIKNESKNLCIAGDFNTSFIDNCYISKPSKNKIIDLCAELNVDLTTGKITKNIDHIFLSNNIVDEKIVTSNIFIERDKICKDHQGIVVEIKGGK